VVLSRPFAVRPEDALAASWLGCQANPRPGTTFVPRFTPNLIIRAILGPLALAAAMVEPADGGEPFWRQIMPRQRVEADSAADYTLAENNGPWLIMAASFDGEQGEREARDLVLELRSKFNLPAFYYGMTFTMDDERPGRGLDDYGGRIKRRYQRGSAVVEHAVLVGEFPTIDDPEAQGLLDRVKMLEPQTLKVGEGESTSQSLATVRNFNRYVKQQLGKPVRQGPMGHAFLTRNPLLPKEYFTPPGVDQDVAKWNDGIQYSLLSCPGKYTIKVATFRGRTSLQAANGDEGDKGVRQARVDDPLVVAVKNAHLLTEALRSKGWEAYEFHDRYESYVTVGAFNEMHREEDGRLVAKTREAQIIIDTFGAATPNSGFDRAAYEELGMKDDAIRKAEYQRDAIKQQFKTRFAQGMGQMSEGFYPKQFVGLPFDIQPCPIEAPKKSISSAYVRN